MTANQSAEFRQDILGKFSVRASDNGPLAGSMSASHVISVIHRSGRPAVLKLTPREAGSSALRAAGHELEFYTSFAETIPIRTPALLNHYRGDNGIAILLSAHGQREPADAWDARRWMALAADLALLHTMPISGWQRDWPLMDSLRNPDHSTIERFWRPSLGSSLDIVLDQRTMLEQLIFGSDLSFLHGDCRTDNILHEDGKLVWVDWQAAGFGNLALDWALLSVRATPSGARIPAAALAEYCRMRGIDFELIHRSVVAAEMSIFVFEWPPYAGFNTPAGVERVRHRTRQLVQQWFS